MNDLTRLPLPGREAAVPDGRPADALTVVPDLCALKQAERRLAELHAEQRRLLQAIPDPVWVKGPDGRYVACNSAWAQMLGRGEEEIVGADDHALFPDATAAAFRTKDEQAAAGEPLTSEESILLCDGRRVLVETRRVPMRDGDGTPAGVLGIARDITLRKRSEERLRVREQEFRALVENSPDTVVRYDRDCRRLYVNPRFATALGIPPEQLIGTTPSATGAARDAALIEQAIRRVFASGEEQEQEIYWRSRDGKTFCSHARIVPERDAGGTVVSVLVVGHDVSDLKESERRLRQAETMAQLGYWEWDFTVGRASVSSEVCRIFAKPRDWAPTREEVFGHIIDEDRERIRTGLAAAYHERREETAFEYRVRVGERLLYLNSHLRIEYGPAGAPARIVGTTQDVSTLKEYQERLHSLSFFDTVTGLPNRALLTKHIERATAESLRNGRQVAVLAMDLDDFNAVNDTLGHAVGDQLLRETAHRLAGLVRESDLVARIGGDEFAVVLGGMANEADIERIGRKLLDAVADAYLVDGRELFLSGSIGIARYPADGAGAADLLQHADVAMYEAKKGRNAIHFYSAKLSARTAEQLALTHRLRSAERNGELELYFQPQVDLASGRLLGAEALLRWNHPELGVVTPDRFIRLAEETGLIIGIGEWVLRQACATACAWNERRAGERLRIAINLSARQFRGNDLVDTIARTLAATRCAPEWIELEITESLLLDDGIAVREMLGALNDMGIAIAIDDFGTGYSALGYLNRFPVQTLKIDRSFVRNILVDRGSAELVKAILSMASSLRLAVVAEGIEEQEQAALLRSHGCAYGQGYLFGRPVPRARFEAELLEQGTGRP